jgi:hypothetical protein
MNHGPVKDQEMDPRSEPALPLEEPSLCLYPFTFLKNKLLILSLMLLLLFADSCAPAIGLEATNNTGQDIVVLSIDQYGNQTSYPLSNGQASGIKVSYKLRVKHTDGFWDYEFPPLPAEKYLKRIAGNAYIERVQIEHGGVIYARSPGSPRGPSSELPAQPPGYPIRPK